MPKLVFSELTKKLKTKDFNFWQSSAEKRVLKLFHSVAKRVPAYKDFLRKNNVDSIKIKIISDFANLPVIDKKNYIGKYDLKDLCWDGELTKGGIIAQSSGTTGAPHFWPRFSANDKETALLHKIFFKNLYATYDKETLFIVCFHLSAHIAGIITANAIKDLIDEGMPGSLVTAGLSKEDILNSINKLSGFYKQTILIGYPPFLMDVINDAESRGMKLAEKNIKFMFSAESFPEKWREKLYHKVGAHNMEMGGYNVYGSADQGFLGHETPFTIRLRQLFESGKIDKNKIGIGNNHVPGIYQYHTWNKYFEKNGNELICTSDSGVPLIRYNTHDVGIILNPKEVSEIYKEEKLFKTNDWQLPLLLVFGRSNYSATLYGVNIYPEHIREILSKDEFAAHLNGKFFIKTVFDGENQFLEIHAELSKDGIKHKAEELKEIISGHLKEINMEYKKLYEAVGGKAHPILVVYEHGSDEFKNLKSKHKYIVHSQKPIANS